MFPLILIVLSSILAPSVANPTGPRCGANHTQLLLFVDLGHQDRLLTVTRLKNIVTYFTTKVKDGIIQTLDVYMMDPVQQKTLLNLTNVDSSGILIAMDLLLDSKLWPIYNFNDNDIDADLFLSQTVEYSKRILLHVMSEDRNNPQSIIVFLLPCPVFCLYSVFSLSFEFKHHDFLMMFLISVTFKKESEEYTYNNLMNEYQFSTINEKDANVAFVHAKDDFARHNPVILYLCNDCPEAWTRFNWGDHRCSCYFVSTLATHISWIQATRSCASLESTLPNIETEDEYIFLKELISNIPSANDNNTTGISATTFVNVGLFERQGLYQRYYVWSNLSPFLLNTSIDTCNDRRQQDRCVALHFYVHGITLMKIVCDKPKSEILVCEMDVGVIPHIFRQGEKFLATWQDSPKTEMTGWKPNSQTTEIQEYKWSKFDCQDGVNLISYESVCDGEKDCRNGRDEEFCNTVSTLENLNTFFCTNPNGDESHPICVSIPMDKRCNFVQDCPDNSDELGCDGCLDKQCGDGTCVPSHWLSHDSQECHLFIAANRAAYLNASHECRGHCNGSMESTHEITFCNTNINLDDYSLGEIFYNNFSSGVVWAPKCIYLRGSGGGPMGCQNKNHLRDCRTFACPEGFLKCLDSYCIPWHYVGDKTVDCPFGEDKELNTKYLYYEVICRPTFLMIHPVNRCDGIPQCARGDDEKYCPMICPPGFKCHGSAVQVHDRTQVKEITSLNIFDLNTRYLNISSVDLSHLNKLFIFRNLFVIQACNCSLEDLDKIFGNDVENKFTYSVSLSYNKLTKIYDNGPLASLTNLQFLNLSHNEQLSQIEIQSIVSKKLQSLDLSFTGISSFTFVVLEEYNTLRQLNLRHTKLAKIESFSGIINLEFLNLENTSLAPGDMAKLLKYATVSSALYVDNYKFCCPQISGAGSPQHACHAPPEAFSSCEDLLSDELKRSLLWLVAGVSLAGNIMVVTYRLLYDRGVFKKGYGIFVTNLSMSDCVMGVYLLIIASTDVRYRDEYVLHESDWRHSSLCQAAGFLSTLSSETSTFFVFFITLDRCLVIRFPFGDHWFSKLGLILSVLSAWIFGFILALVPLIYPQWIIYSSNGMCLGLPLVSDKHPGWHYSFGLFICFNFILFLCIACGQFSIARLIFSVQKFQMTNAQIVARRIQDINVAKQLLLVALSNFLCWFPICVLGFLTLTGHEVSPDTYAWLVVFVVPLNAAINPMIYTIPVMYRKWREFKRGELIGANRRNQMIQVNK